MLKSVKMAAGEVCAKIEMGGWNEGRMEAQADLVPIPSVILKRGSWLTRRSSNQAVAAFEHWPISGAIPLTCDRRGFRALLFEA